MPRCKIGFAIHMKTPPMDLADSKDEDMARLALGIWAVKILKMPEAMIKAMTIETIEEVKDEQGDK